MAARPKPIASEGAETTARKLPAHLRDDLKFKPGQSGNPAGRPKGSRHKLGQEFLEKMLNDFAEHGAAVITAVREDKPDQYLKVVASILPKELEASEETINAIAELMNRIDGRTRSIIPDNRPAVH